MLTPLLRIELIHFIFLLLFQLLLPLELFLQLNPLSLQLLLLSSFLVQSCLLLLTLLPLPLLYLL